MKTLNRILAENIVVGNSTRFYNYNFFYKLLYYENIKTEYWRKNILRK